MVYGIKINQWESQCYNCGVVFRNYHTRFSKTVPRKQQLINIRQNPSIKVFCSEKCKFEYIFIKALEE